MPSKVVEVPGVGNVEFPDSMSDEQISAVLVQHSKQAKAPPAEDKGFLRGAWDSSVGPLVAGLVTHPIDTVNSAADSLVQDLYDRPLANLRDPKQPLARAIPLVGPMAGDIVDKWRSGRKAEALGNVAGLATMGLADPRTAPMESSVKLRSPITLKPGTGARVLHALPEWASKPIQAARDSVSVRSPIVNSVQRPTPAWKGLLAPDDVPAPAPPPVEAIPAALPSGRRAGGIRNATAPAAPAPVAEAPAPPPVDLTGTRPTIQHAGIAAQELAIKNKVANIHEFLNQAGATAESLEKMSPGQLQNVAEMAYEYGKKKGNPVPKAKYRGLEGDTLKMVIDRLRKPRATGAVAGLLD